MYRSFLARYSMLWPPEFEAKCFFFFFFATFGTTVTADLFVLVRDLASSYLTALTSQDAPRLLFEGHTGKGRVAQMHRYVSCSPQHGASSHGQTPDHGLLSRSTSSGQTRLVPCTPSRSYPVSASRSSSFRASSYDDRFMNAMYFLRQQSGHLC